MRLLILVTMILLAGCNSVSVRVDGTFPSPLVKQLPLAMGVYYSDDFRNFEHEEKAKSSKYSIATGDSQVALFNTMFEGFFADTKQLDSFPQEIALEDVRAVISPEVEELQLSVPRQSRSEIYEVWIKYRMRVYHPDGSLLADWPISAYGKTPIGFLKGGNAALQQAAIIALRDAGATFSTSFIRQPIMQQLLESGALESGYGDERVSLQNSDQGGEE